MKIGLVGYQASGKSSIFELLTGVQPDIAKAHTGQIGTAIVPDQRFDDLVALFSPKKVTPAKIELFDTPGLSREQGEGNAQRMSVLREANVLIHVIGAYAGADPLADAQSFEDDLMLADLQVVTNRVNRLRDNVKKPRPDRDELQAELEQLEPIEAALNEGESLREREFTEDQEKFTKSFSLLSRKPQLVLINTAEAEFDQEKIAAIEALGHRVIAAPAGLELDVQQLDEADRAEFAAELGLGEPCKDQLLRAIFELTDQITFFTADEKEVRAWLLHRGETAVDAAGTIHTDLARGFIRAEIMAVADLLRLGSEREVKAAGLHQLVGKEYVMQDGDEIVVRFNV